MVALKKMIACGASFNIPHLPKEKEMWVKVNYFPFPSYFIGQTRERMP